VPTRRGSVSGFDRGTASTFPFATSALAVANRATYDRVDLSYSSVHSRLPPVSSRHVPLADEVHGERYTASPVPSSWSWPMQRLPARVSSIENTWRPGVAYAAGEDESAAQLSRAAVAACRQAARRQRRIPGDEGATFSFLRGVWAVNRY
jgi:hypothetical protein